MPELMKELKTKDLSVWRVIGAQKLRADIIYCLSQFVISKRTEKHLYLFHTMTLQCYQTELTAVKERLTSEEIAQDPILKQLMEDWFFVREDYDELQMYESTYKLLRLMDYKEGFHRYVIYPTSKCNARCVYCVQENMEKKPMRQETAMQVASFIVESHRKNKSVRLTWWGGEPLLEEKKIDCITEYLRDNNVRFSSNMITNGSLINDRIIRKMSDQWNMKLVQISFDSAEQEYIRRKQYYTYHNEYFTIMDRVNELSQTKVNVMIRCNVDMGNIPYAEEFIGDLKKAIKDPSKVSLYFSPLHQSRATDGERVWKNVFRLDQIARREGFINRYNTLPDSFRVYYCESDGTGEVVIDTDGRLFGCEVCPEGTSFGDVWNGIVDTEKWNSHNVICIIQDKCKKCPYLPLCTPFSACPHVSPDCKAIPKFEVDMGFENLIEQYDSYVERNS